MRASIYFLVTVGFSLVLISCDTKRSTTDDISSNQENSMNLDQYPHIILTNEAIEMKVYLPDPEKGLYRATRFDWSGVIGSLKYKGHEYFDYWKDTHDPLIHEDLPGPVEGFIEPGLGYEEAGAGDGFIRIGVGILEKRDEEKYGWTDTYKILDHGKWTVDQGKDWISFTHVIASDFGFAYKYIKRIELLDEGFVIRHTLENTGDKTIETDQFNHNFFVIDKTQSGTDFSVEFPFSLQTESDTRGLVSIDDKKIKFEKMVEQGKSTFLELTGFGESADDHQVTVVNHKTGAGIKFAVDQPIYRMAFWTCKTTLCPENFIWIDVEPGETMQWNSTYTVFEQ